MFKLTDSLKWNLLLSQDITELCKPCWVPCRYLYYCSLPLCKTYMELFANIVNSLKELKAIKYGSSWKRVLRVIEKTASEIPPSILPRLDFKAIVLKRLRRIECWRIFCSAENLHLTEWTSWKSSAECRKNVLCF